MIYSLRSFVRLCRRQCIYQKKRYNHVRATSENIDKTQSEKNEKGKDFQRLLENYKDKITFSSYLEHEKLELGYFKYHLKTLKIAKLEQKKQYLERSLSPLPVALQYYVDKDRLLKGDLSVDQEDTSEEIVQLPFANTTNVETNKHESTVEEPQHTNLSNEKSEFDCSDIDKWMTNYEYFDDSKLDEEVLDDWSKQYGTPDPTVGISRVPCGGCGALLHCNDPAIPGYLPSEIFVGRSNDALKTMECQRCHFLKEYNIALDVNVQPEEYENLLQSIRYVNSMVILMVDLLDFPCSIWPNIVDIVGTKRPIILVGNKVDLLPADSYGYLKRIKESLLNEILKTKLSKANIKYVALISAKTGYGVEDLITVMFKEWLYKGDVFLVGSTNVGKSSLFNAMLQSDYCKVHAVDIVKRATVSRWPGTTLNLLKFPINRPSGWKIYERTKRLKYEAKIFKMEKEIMQSQSHSKQHHDMPQLIGHIGRSFAVPLNEVPGEVPEIMRKMMVLNENDKLFAQSKWFYDTPGVILPDQVLSLLSTEELLLTIPKKLIRPQTYYLHKGLSLFLGGLARIDHIDCAYPCRFTIFCSESLPITVTKTEDADEVYKKFLGTELFAVPVGGTKRMSLWPELQQGKEIFEFQGEGPKLCCGDVVLSSVGWVAVTAKRGSVCRVAAWTPEGRGIHRRYPSVLPFAINLKGKRLRDAPAYMIGNPICVNDK